MDEQSKLIILGIVGGLCIVAVAIVIVYMRQGRRWRTG